MLSLVHHQHSVQIRLYQQLMNPFIGEAKLHELDVLTTPELQLVTCLRHLPAFVNLREFNAVEIISHSDSHDKTVSHKYFNFVQVIVLGLVEKQRVIKLLVLVPLELIF